MQATSEYHKLLQTILDEGRWKGDRTGTGTLSIFDYKIKFDMSEGFPLITTKKMYTRGIIHELLWFLNGDTNIKYLVDNNVNIWNGDAYREYKKRLPENVEVLSPEEFKEEIKNNADFARDQGNLGPVYGKQWVDFNGVNQIQQAIDKLKNKPDDRRIMVSTWDPSKLSEMALPPCHWAFELYTEELTNDERKKWVLDNVDWVKDDHDANKYLHRGEPKIYGDSVPKRRLSLKWHQRSVDTFLGLPFNIASYAFLLHMFAQQANMVPHELVGDLTNVHLYKNHIDYVKEQLERNPTKHNAPTLNLKNYIEIDAGDNGQRVYNNDLFKYRVEDFVIENYTSEPNWKNVPLAT